MSEYIVDLSEVEKTSDRFKMLFSESILLGERVVRCRDCAYSIHFLHHDDERWQCTEPHQEGDDVKPDAYCWRGRRKEGGDD